MNRFSAQARVLLADPEAVVGPLCEHMLEHGAEVEKSGGAHILKLRGTSVRFTREGAATLVDVDAANLEELYYARMTVASHILEFSGASVPEIAWEGDGRQLSRPPNFQIFEVAGVGQVTPRMRRITLAGEDVARFAQMEALHLNILVQHPDVGEPQWPTVGPNGLVGWADPDRRPSFRKYTVRSVDVAACRIDVDFVLHADAGPGSAFAENAAKGDRVGIVGPGGGGLAEADWYLFAGDETALPAIGRMLEHLPASARGKALIEVADEREIQPLHFKAAVDVEWLFRKGAPAGSTTLLADAVRRTGFPRDGSAVYAWAGCEFDAFRALRSYLRKEIGLKKHEHLVVSYWRRGMSEEEA
ncbi:siderophore-interacting protein [Aquamicrobium sp. LC103]|uniref:siderophore-interacting protein n=1 Tax=Aquamicrobium sp. LC103 TaxID=1120658 RepID=UPI00063EABC6|nr:siderophore-interacting protein [Aquamicrobium sp. LC103]TKT74172.1 siderophore-interacting protein [Aquamicrobium sp. LC103]